MFNCNRSSLMGGRLIFLILCRSLCYILNTGTVIKIVGRLEQSLQAEEVISEVRFTSYASYRLIGIIKVLRMG